MSALQSVQWSRYLLPPHRDQLLRVQYDVKTVVPLVGVIHGPLVNVGLDGAQVPGVDAVGDPHPVAASLKLT